MTNLDEYITTAQSAFSTKGIEGLEEFSSFIPQHIQGQFNFMLKESNHHLSLSLDSFAVKFSNYIQEIFRINKT